MNLIALEILSGLVILIFYIAVPERLRNVNNFKNLIINFVFAGLVLALFTALALKLNDYSLERMGIGINYITDASSWSFFLTLFGIVILGIWGWLRGNKLSLNPGLVKLSFVYPIWSYLQLLLILGIFSNFIRDYLGTSVAIIAGGLIFGGSHFGKQFHFSLILVGIGLSWSLIFHQYPNLIPLAISHGLLASLYYYWWEGIDKWEEIFGSIRRT